MQQLKIHQLSETGVLESEIEALKRISISLPPEWLAFANFEFRDRIFGNREIDLVLVTKNAIVLVELKNWNGNLHSNGNLWICNGQNRGNSPVIVTNDKAKKLHALLTNREGHHFSAQPYITPIVVLCGSAGPQQLSDEDKGFTVTLNEFCSIGEERIFKKIFPSVRTRKTALYKEKELFNRFFSLKTFEARKHRYGNYIPVGKPFFKHEGGLYEEWIAEHERTKGYRALLRTWDLSALPTNYSTEAQWKSITNRETEVIGYLRENLSQETIKSSVLVRIGEQSDTEQSSAHFDLYELPNKAELLDSYINRFSKRITFHDRIQIAKSLVRIFAQLHEINVAHRDISETSIWTGHDLNLQVSRWLASAFPEGRTVGDLRAFLHSGRSVAPEDAYDVPSDPYKRDVFLLARVLHFIFSGTQLPVNDGVVEYQPIDNNVFSQSEKETLSKLEEVLEKSLSWEPKDRYPNALELSEALELSLQEFNTSVDLFRKKLEPFVALTNPYVSFPLGNQLAQSPVHIYECELESTSLIVKIWPSLQPSSSNEGVNLRLFEFLTKCSDIKRTSHPIVQSVVEFGLSPVGLYLVVEKCDGLSLDHHMSESDLSLPERIALSLAIIKGIRSIHESGIAHTDLRPSNIIVDDKQSASTAVRFVDIPDIDIAGGAKFSDDYSEVSRSHNPFDTDRFACLLIVIEILGGHVQNLAGRKIAEFDAVLLEVVEEEVNQRLADELPVKSLTPLLDSLEAAYKQNQLPSLQRVTIPLRNLTVRRPLMPDNDEYYVMLNVLTGNRLNRLLVSPEEDRYVEVTFFGIQDSLQVVWDSSQQCIVTGRVNYNVPEFLKKRAAVRVRAFIVFEVGQRTEFQGMEALVREELGEKIARYLDSSKRGADSKKLVGNAAPLIESEVLEESVTASVKDLWRALVDAESSVLPEIEIVDEPNFIGKGARVVQFMYERSNGFPLEFDSNERVLVHLVALDRDPRTIGELVRGEITDEVMSVRLTREVQLAAGDVLKLEGLLGKASYDKRKQAVNRLVAGESVLPHLIDWIDGSKVVPFVEKIRLVEQISQLPEALSLNNAQKSALELALSTSPISLVQGPPGTGKTLFIAALVYIIDSARDDNVLLTSQSNEAVNNCIEKLIAVYEGKIEDLDLVRVGPIEMCSDSVSRYHIDNIQQRYRRSFETDMRYRLENSAKALGLPDQFVRQYIRLALALRPLVEQYKLLNLDRESEEDVRLDSAIEGLTESAKGRVRRISQRLVWPTKLDVREAAQDLRNQLISLHQISSDDSTVRLNELIEIAYEWNNALNSPHGNFAEFLARTKKVVVGTCVGIGRKSLNISSQKFDWVIIDEAARCTSGELAVPSAVGERLVLVGDHQQLPPLYPPEVIQEAKENLNSSTGRLLLISDFRRLILSEYGKSSSQQLTTQYRMNPAIGDLVSNVFYKDTLVNGKDRGYLNAADLPTFLKSEVTWLDSTEFGSKGYEAREKDPYGNDSTSYINRLEVNQILMLLENIESSEAAMRLLQEYYDKMADPPIGVICTYAGQKRELIRRFRENPHSDEFRSLVKIDTVDSYQGKENLVIIQSLVRNNSRGECGFLDSPERVNVAVSRAMERLFIVGAASMWSDRDVALGRVYRLIRERADHDDRYDVVNLAGTSL
jgi:serine/threonine protein kinase